MLAKLGNVTIYRESRMTAEDIAAFGADHVVLAVGSRWRRDGIGVVRDMPVEIAPDAPVATPADLAGLNDPVVIYDDDHYFMGGALAEKLKRDGRDVTYVTSQPMVSSWTQMTDEQYLIEPRLVGLDIRIAVSHVLQAVKRDHAVFSSTLSKYEVTMPLGSLILVTGREPDDDLYRQLAVDFDMTRVTRIGDCLSPSHIADAVFAGHRYAREYGEARPLALPLRERPQP
jgi:dimethylamine/trimethylamine dehydrogenase